MEEIKELTIRVKNKHGEFYFDSLPEALHNIKAHWRYTTNFISQRKNNKWIGVSTEWSETTTLVN